MSRVVSYDRRAVLSTHPVAFVLVIFAEGWTVSDGDDPCRPEHLVPYNSEFWDILKVCALVRVPNLFACL